jgi:hypothetical protein
MHRGLIALDGNASLLRLGRAMGGLLNLSQVRVDASRDPEILAISYRVLLPLALLAAHVDEAALLSSTHSTACSKVIARPSARASSKASSPIWERTAATVLSYGER